MLFLPQLSRLLGDSYKELFVQCCRKGKGMG